MQTLSPLKRLLNKINYITTENFKGLVPTRLLRSHVTLTLGITTRSDNFAENQAVLAKNCFNM